MPFRDVTGHRKLMALLARSVARESMPPSLLFSGPAGVGKRLVAIAVAQAANCLAPRRTAPGDAGDRDTIQYDACGTCASCVRIARGVHPDVILLQPGDSGSIKIDPVRDLVERSAYRPFEGRRRVVIIDEADALVPGAQNALLKTLEEPPSGSQFILISSRPDALLATVRSRCPRLRFRELGQDDVAAVLMKMGRSEAEARAIAATADGSLRQGLDLDAGDLTASRDVALRALQDVAARAEPGRRIESGKTLLEKAGSAGGTEREQLASRLRAMLLLLRDLAVLDTGADRRVLAHPDVAPALERLSGFQGDRVVRAFAGVDQALAALDRNAGVKIVADWVALSI